MTAKLFTDVLVEHGGEDWLFAQIESGRTVIALAEDLGVDRSTAYRWLHATEDRQRRLREARETSAFVMAEEGRELLATATPQNIKIRNAQVRHDEWMSERFNRNAFGKQPEIAVQLSVGELHLIALKASNPSDPRSERVEIEVENPDHEITNLPPERPALLPPATNGVPVEPDSATGGHTAVPPEGAE